MHIITWTLLQYKILSGQDLCMSVCKNRCVWDREICVYKLHTLWKILMYYITTIYIHQKGTDQPLSRSQRSSHHQFFGIQETNAILHLKKRKIFSVFPCFLKLLVVVFVWWVFCALLPIIGRPGFIVAAPVTFAYDPRQNVHFVVEFCWEFDADQVGCSCPFAPGDQLHVIIIAAVLRCERRALQRQHGADAVSCCGLIDLQFFLWTTRILPAEAFPLKSVKDFSSAVRNFSGVGAWAAGKVVDHFVHIFLQELTLAAHPSLTAISICFRAGNGNLRYIKQHPTWCDQWYQLSKV